MTTTQRDSADYEDGWREMEEATSVVPELLRPLWAKRRTAILERISTVERALREADVSVDDGCTEAHKLRGLLGTFGFSVGSEIAGAAEDLLSADDPARSGWTELADQFADFAHELDEVK